MILLDEQGRALIETQRRGSFWRSRIGRSLRRETGRWFLGVTLAVVSVFSTHLTERLKFAVNRADLRSASYERLAEDISEHMFLLELIEEYLAQGWTTAASLEPLIKDYNESITRLRKRELVYRAQLAKFWGTAARRHFAETMTHVRKIDVAIHGLNGELEAVVIKKTQNSVTRQRALDAAAEIARTFALLRASAEQLLEA